MELYIEAATRHVTTHVAKGTTSLISRRNVDFWVLTSLDRSELDLEFKFAWYDAVSVSCLIDLEDNFCRLFSSKCGLDLATLSSP